jgi:hypothetical protein
LTIDCFSGEMPTNAYAYDPRRGFLNWAVIEAAGDALRLGDGYGTTLTMSRCAWA